MTMRYLEYQLNDGFIDNWLVAGPQAWSVEELAGAAQSDAAWKDQAVQQYSLPEMHLPLPPVDRGKFGEEGEAGLTWNYFRCMDDHLVDASYPAGARQYARAWAYAQITTQKPGGVNLALTLTGPGDVWLNGQRLWRGERFAPEGKLQTVCIPVELAAENELVVRFEQVGVGPLPLAFAAQLTDFSDQGAAEALVVRVPTQTRYPHRQQMFEQAFDKAYLEQPTNHRGKSFMLRFNQEANEGVRFAWQVQDDKAMIYVEGGDDITFSHPIDVGHTQRLFERPYQVVLRAMAKEYFEQNMRYQRALPVHILDNTYSSLPYGTYESRRREALEDAAKREGSLFNEIARMMLEQWSRVDTRTLDAAVEIVKRGEQGSEVQLVGLLGLLARFGEKEEFPQGVAEQVESIALLYDYQGVSAANEGGEILKLTAQILAGQRYPDSDFAKPGLNGTQMRADGQRKAAAWITQRGERGFADWDSPAAIEGIVTALSHLVSLAEDEALRDLAAVLMDKLLFLMAVNGINGLLGGSMGQGSAAMLPSPMLQSTAGISRLLWGMGVFNLHTTGTVSLATSDYEFPSFFAEIAAHQPEELWSRERLEGQRGEVNKVIYKTPDYLLGAVQDYHPGQPGRGEHIWQATLGPDAAVFVNHPASFSMSAARQPGFWLGNGSLPRVAQWKDALIAVYNLPEDAWLDFTHAYFPVYAFDEYSLEGNWAFARRGEAYVALYAVGGLELIQRAPDAFRELRSPGRQNAWVCQMGRAQTDGEFEQFKQKALALPVAWQGMALSIKSLRDEELKLGWEGPFTVRGEEVPLAGGKHVDNFYCQADFPAEQMDIGLGDYLLRLNFR